LIWPHQCSLEQKPASKQRYQNPADPARLKSKRVGATEKYLVGEEVVNGPRQAGCAVEPEAEGGGDVLESNGLDVVTVSVGDVKPALEELDDDLELPADLKVLDVVTLSSHIV
jgi:hypothetical protein